MSFNSLRTSIKTVGLKTHRICVTILPWYHFLPNQHMAFIYFNFSHHFNSGATFRKTSHYWSLCFLLIMAVVLFGSSNVYRNFTAAVQQVSSCNRNRFISLEFPFTRLLFNLFCIIDSFNSDQSLKNFQMQLPEPRGRARTGPPLGIPTEPPSRRPEQNNSIDTYLLIIFRV